MDSAESMKMHLFLNIPNTFTRSYLFTASVGVFVQALNLEWKLRLAREALFARPIQISARLARPRAEVEPGAPAVGSNPECDKRNRCRCCLLLVPLLAVSAARS